MGMTPVDLFNKYPSSRNTITWLACCSFQSAGISGLVEGLVCAIGVGFFSFAYACIWRFHLFRVPPSPFMFFLGILENSCSWLHGPIAPLYLRLLMFYFLFVDSTWKAFSCVFYVGYWVVRCYSHFSFELSSLVFFTDFSFYILGCLPRFIQPYVVFSWAVLRHLFPLTVQRHSLCLLWAPWIHLWSWWLFF